MNPRPDRQTAPGYKPEYQPNAHGFDYFFGFLTAWEKDVNAEAAAAKQGG